jgi:hypothetical protein
MAVTKRRLLGCLGASLLLHAVVVVLSTRRAPAPVAAAEARDSVSFAPIETAPAPRVAMVDQNPSGRGHALAGSNAHRRGSPWHARRMQVAARETEGPGTAGAVPIESNVGRAPRVDDVPVAATAVLVSDVAIPPPSAPAAPPDDAPRPPARPTVDADRTFDEMARAQLMRLSKGDGGGLAGHGRGGEGIGFGLTTELSGQVRQDSPVVAAPVVVQHRPVECELPGTLHATAIVRVLVTRDGTPAVPHLIQPSGYASFDRCALSYVLALRFTAGTDAGGNPLNVWMNVRVSPSTGGQIENVR